MKGRVAFKTLGCKLNQSETAAIKEMFVEKGYEIAPFDSEADIYVINTCTVTGRSDYKSRQAIRQAVRRGGLVCVTGCYAQTNPEEIAALGVNLIVGNTQKAKLPQYVDEAKGEETIFRVEDIFGVKEFEDLEVSTFDSTRAFVKIQDGCNFSCTYCKVPLARGRSRSQSPKKVFLQIERLVRAGYKEVVLTGVDLGSYGKDLGITLASLIKTLLKIPELERLRVSSIEPTEITDEFIELFSSNKICRHLHIPLQSGDDKILQMMGRRYTASQYEKLIRKLTLLIPEICIGTDVLVGFPGETDEQFLKTLTLVKRLPFSYLHVFEFSPRKGTKASKMIEEVAPYKKRERGQVLRRISKEKSFVFRSRFKGKVVSALMLNKKEGGYFVGLTDNYIKLLVPKKREEMKNKIVQLKILRVEKEQTYAYQIVGG